MEFKFETSVTGLERILANVPRAGLLKLAPRSSSSQSERRERERGLKMMLPGVEVARKRRIHNHEIQPLVPHGQVTQWRGPLKSSMAEPAMAARIRLEEKLRGGGAASTSTSPSNSSSRWSQFMRDSANTSRQQNTTTSINSAMTQRLNQVEATTKPAVADSFFLKRVVSRVDELCAVCLEKVRGKKKVMRLPCSHKYHSDCVLPWLAAHPDCPCCRTAVPVTVMLS